MINGGPVTLVYGFIVCFIGSLATAASLAELVSMYPTSGGQYHFVAMLAPPKYSVFLSWITGWVSTIGWNANSAAGVFFGATMIQGLLVLNDASYTAPRWQGTLFMWAFLVVVVIVNTMGSKLLPKIDG
jgi:choline transport protein